MLIKLTAKKSTLNSLSLRHDDRNSLSQCPGHGTSSLNFIDQINAARNEN